MSSGWFQRFLGPSQPLALPRKPLNFQNLPEHLDQLLHVEDEDEESQGMWQFPEWDWGSQTRLRGGSWEPWGAQCPLCILSDPLPCPHPPSFSGQVEGRLGPSTVVLDHTGGFEGLLLVDDDLLGVSEGKGPRSKLLLM